MKTKLVKPTVPILVLFFLVVAGYLASRALGDKRYREYTIQSGDTCSKIAYEHRVSIPKLIEVNKSLKAQKCMDIYIGQKLRIPSPDLPQVEQYNKTGIDDCEKTIYKTGRGDNIYQVALKFNTSIEIIEELNHLNDINHSPSGELVVPLCTPTVTP